MPINFHDEKNRMTYTTRTADAAWIRLIQENVDVYNKQVVDIGCGGGIYTKAFVDMGASRVTGVDFSEEMLKGAARNCSGVENVAFIQGNAYNTTLPSNEYDVILQRALIHHLNNLNACFKETARILKKDGMLVIQDRTPEDILLPGDENHIRGYFFKKFPRLMDKEISRRHSSDTVRTALDSNGFHLMKETQFWEIRRVYDDIEMLSKDLLLRTGRSILHELTDIELRELVSFIEHRLANVIPPIVEKDLWTLWFAKKTG